MEPTEFIWKNGSLIPWKDATVHVLNHTMHYGGGAFEGIRCYKTDAGTAIFRLTEHSERLIYSGEAIGMAIPWSAEEISAACIQVVKENQLEEGYIRPLLYYGYGKMGLNPTGAPVEMIIACWPWGAYLGGDTVKIKTSKYIRIHPQSSITDAKIVGHYVNSIHASLEVQDDDRYDEALFLDFEGNVAEGPGENIFVIHDGKIYTPPLGTILAGITRDTLMTIAKDNGYTIEEKTLTLDDIHNADEAFFTGTAAEVIGIVSLDDQAIGNGSMGPITAKLRQAYADGIRGKLEQYKGWLTTV